MVRFSRCKVFVAVVGEYFGGKMNPRRMHTSKGHHSLQVASNLKDQININSLNWLPYISYNVCCKNFVVNHSDTSWRILWFSHDCLQMDSEKLKKSENTLFLKNSRQIHVILLCKLFGLKQHELWFHYVQHSVTGVTHCLVCRQQPVTSHHL